MGIENFFDIRNICAFPNCSKESSWWGISPENGTSVFELCKTHGEYTKEYLEKVKELEDWYVSSNKEMDENEAVATFRKEENKKNPLHSLQTVSPMQFRCWHKRNEVVGEPCNEKLEKFGIGIDYASEAVLVIESCKEHAIGSSLGAYIELLDKLKQKSKEGSWELEDVIKDLSLDLATLKGLSSRWFELRLGPKELDGIQHLARSLGTTFCHWCKTATFDKKNKFCNDICEENMKKKEKEMEILAKENKNKSG